VKARISPLQNADDVNSGYTDQNFDYVASAGEVLDSRYQVIRMVGKGSFGVVVEAHDMLIKENVALKIIKTRKSFFRQAFTEIRILEKLNAQDPNNCKNIVRLKRHFQHKNHLCLVYELLSFNLYELLRSKKFSGLSINLVRKFSYQILVALHFLHSKNIQVIHCDLKPENILLRNAKKSALKVIDFGSSCFANEKIYTYIQSRFYRSPEVILNRGYGYMIDIWSLGCILVELFTGRPLFTGRDEHDQMCQICDLLGMPPAYILETSRPEKIEKMFIKLSATEYRLIPSIHFKPQNISLSEIIKAKHAENAQRLQSNKSQSTDQEVAKFIDLVSRMLQYDAAKRITTVEALTHPFFRPLITIATQTNTNIYNGYNGDVKDKSNLAMKSMTAIIS